MNIHFIDLQETQDKSYKHCHPSDCSKFFKEFNGVNRITSRLVYLAKDPVKHFYASLFQAD
jgi:hypothetical protein